MLEFGVDEMTLVMQLDHNQKSVLATADWEEVAERLIYTFEKKADLITTLGKKDIEKKLPKGYAIGYKYGEHPFYFCVAYHPYQWSMGVAVKFSAQALDYYNEETGLNVYQFMQKVGDRDYTIRLSRIDMTADYIDEDIDITEIYNSLMHNEIGIFREYESKKTGDIGYKRVPMMYEGFLKGSEVPTIYVGSVQSNSRLRIYDKRREQIERKGTKFDKAVGCRNWVRFEGVFRHDYAHQISDELLHIQSDDEYVNLIATTLAQKYRFMTVDRKTGEADTDTNYTQMILDAIANKSFQLKAPSTRNYDLAQNIAYIFSGSGVMNTLYKIWDIWDMDAVMYLLEYIIEALQGEFRPNADCLSWIIRNRKDYQKKYSDFDVFMQQSVSCML